MNQLVSKTSSNPVSTMTAPPTISLMDPATFDQMQRVGKMLALSPLFPEHLRKGNIDASIANGVLVLNMAMRLREDPLTVAQSIYFVGGKPGWSASYMISKANQHGVFRDPIDWEIKGEKETLSVTAFGVLAATGKKVKVTCDMAMAKAEGWTKNTKYNSMPEQMLRYRSATFLIRLYCPEVMVGVPAAIEHELTMRDVTPDYEPAPSGRESDVTTIDADPEEEAPAKVTEAPKRQERAEKPASTDTAKRQEPDAVADETGAGQGELLDQGRTRDAGNRDREDAALEREALETVKARICGDIMDGRDPDEAVSAFADQVELMKSKAPDLFDEIQSYVDEVKGNTSEEDAVEE